MSSRDSAADNSRDEMPKPIPFQSGIIAIQVISGIVAFSMLFFASVLVAPLYTSVLRIHRGECASSSCGLNRDLDRPVYLACEPRQE